MKVLIGLTLITICHLANYQSIAEIYTNDSSRIKIALPTGFLLNSSSQLYKEYTTDSIDNLNGPFIRIRIDQIDGVSFENRLRKSFNDMAASVNNIKILQSNRFQTNKHNARRIDYSYSNAKTNKRTNCSMVYIQVDLSSALLIVFSGSLQKHHLYIDSFNNMINSKLTIDTNVRMNKCINNAIVTEYFSLMNDIEWAIPEISTIKEYVLSSNRRYLHDETTTFYKNRLITIDSLLKHIEQYVNSDKKELQQFSNNLSSYKCLYPDELKFATLLSEDCRDLEIALSNIKSEYIPLFEHRLFNDKYDENLDSAINALNTLTEQSIKNAEKAIGTLKDIDGNIYKTVKIGNQTWLAENIRTTRFVDSTPIPLVADKAHWCKLHFPGYCWYNNEINNREISGALYNWYAIYSGKLAPNGWHVPSDKDWSELEKYLIANRYNWDNTLKSNKIAKSLSSHKYWNSENVTKGSIAYTYPLNNSSQFNALPAGIREDMGNFTDIWYATFFWSSTEMNESKAWYRSLHAELENSIKDCCEKQYGFSVRLLKNE